MRRLCVAYECAHVFAGLSAVLAAVFVVGTRARSCRHHICFGRITEGGHDLGFFLDDTVRSQFGFLCCQKLSYQFANLFGTVLGLG